MERTTVLTPRMLEARDIRERRRDERKGKGPTYRQIGEEMGLSTERVRCLLVIGDRRVRAAEWVQRDAHVSLWRQLMTEALQAIRRTSAHRQLVAVHQQTVAAKEQMRKWTGWALDLPLSGPFNTLPRFKRHGPPQPFNYTRLYQRQREAAVEWFMRCGMSREAAVAYYENNERGIVSYG